MDIDESKSLLFSFESLVFAADNLDSSFSAVNFLSEDAHFSSTIVIFPVHTYRRIHCIVAGGFSSSKLGILNDEICRCLSLHKIKFVSKGTVEKGADLNSLISVKY